MNEVRNFACSTSTKNTSAVLSRYPEDCSSNQGDVTRIFVGRRAVAEFDVDNARLFVLMTPSDDVFARRIIGRQQDMHLRIDPVVIVGLIRDIEVFETPCDRAGWVSDVHVQMLIVLVG